jgi:hypothetical protein
LNKQKFVSLNNVFFWALTELHNPIEKELSWGFTSQNFQNLGFRFCVNVFFRCDLECDQSGKKGHLSFQVSGFWQILCKKKILMVE